jgi:hypothetical protein
MILPTDNIKEYLYWQQWAQELNVCGSTHYDIGILLVWIDGNCKSRRLGGCTFPVFFSSAGSPKLKRPYEPLYSFANLPLVCAVIFGEARVSARLLC